jgi:hypothetical protein
VSVCWCLHVSLVNKLRDQRVLAMSGMVGGDNGTEARTIVVVPANYC